MTPYSFHEMHRVVYRVHNLADSVKSVDEAAFVCGQISEITRQIARDFHVDVSALPPPCEPGYTSLGGETGLLSRLAQRLKRE